MKDKTRNNTFKKAITNKHVKNFIDSRKLAFSKEYHELVTDCFTHVKENGDWTGTNGHSANYL